MKKYLLLPALVTVAALSSVAQSKADHGADGNVASSDASSRRRSSVSDDSIWGRTYRSTTHGFEIRFPDSWVIEEGNGEGAAGGEDLDLSSRTDISLKDKLRINQALKRVSVLVTAHRSDAGSGESAMMRVSVEDLLTVPQVKDAVDYFDLMRSQFAAMTLPADFKYSETQAEKLGRKQFAFLDTSSKDGKTRMYATVRGRHAILFTVSYSSEADLEVLRQMLANAKFGLLS